MDGTLEPGTFWGSPVRPRTLGGHGPNVCISICILFFIYVYIHNNVSAWTLWSWSLQHSLLRVRMMRFWISGSSTAYARTHVPEEETTSAALLFYAVRLHRSIWIAIYMKFTLVRLCGPQLYEYYHKTKDKISIVWTYNFWEILLKKKME